MAAQGRMNHKSQEKSTPFGVLRCRLIKSNTFHTGHRAVCRSSEPWDKHSTLHPQNCKPPPPFPQPPPFHLSPSLCSTRSP